ncbi:MarR family winged helix-turn-helix transcriptional regulator [Nocardia aobensis]|uniref:MarR family winged helix-turn-helix transcriptional regulator n=1 Tax=Nocardia aobensis TaxID=257277 RepID=A0ABW6PF76_9NOCA
MSTTRSPDIREIRAALIELAFTTSQLDARADDALRPTGQNLLRYQILSSYVDSPATVSNVARALFVSRQYVQRTTNSLQEGGFVESHPNPDHLRSPLFEATESGRKLAAAAESTLLPWLGHLQNAISRRELANLREALSTLHAAATSYGPLEESAAPSD